MTTVSERQTLLVGSYTEAYAGFRALGEGVSLLRLDASTGKLTVLDALRGIPNPTYVGWHSAHAAHAALETSDARSGVAFITRDAEDRLHLAHRVDLDGALACHFDRRPGAPLLAFACYGSGHVYGVDLDAAGRPAAPRLLHRHVGSSVHPVRQTSSHPHAACFTPNGRYLLVPDLGTDEIWCHALDAPVSAPRRFAMPRGSGPRLCLFDRDGSHLILGHELGCFVSSWRWDGETLHAVDRCSTLPARFPSPNTTAGLRWHPGGTLFAASNRGADSIALFGFDAASGRITALGHAPSGGPKPRDFEFSPCGRWLIAANQDGDSLVVLAVDAARGSLTPTGERCVVRSPSCVRFAPG